MSKQKSQDKTSAKPGRPRKVMVEHIEYDSENQARERLDQETVAEYAQAMEDGADLPPIVCYHDGSTYWLADGFHRYHAARKRGEKLLDAQVIKGSRDDARWHAAGANTAHGLKRSPADKRRAVRLALELRPNLSDRAIAQHCGVHHETVADVRRGASGGENRHLPAQPRVGLDGKTYPARRPEPRAQATESPVEPSDPWEDSEGEDETAAAPAKAAAAAKAPRVTDRKGNEIPNSLRPEYEARTEEAQFWIRELSAVQSLILDPSARKRYPQIAWHEVEAAFSRIMGSVRYEALPFAVCPYCDGDGRGCNHCKELGWIPRGAWNSVPRELAGGED
jgi:ParB-like chromosome segregation protein Spo0J